MVENKQDSRAPGINSFFSPVRILRVLNTMYNKQRRKNK